MSRCFFNLFQRSLWWNSHRLGGCYYHLTRTWSSMNMTWSFDIISNYLKISILPCQAWPQNSAFFLEQSWSSIESMWMRKLQKHGYQYYQATCEAVNPQSWWGVIIHRYTQYHLSILSVENFVKQWRGMFHDVCHSCVCLACLDSAYLRPSPYVRG